MCYKGGGSGGTIWIECKEIIGHGRMSANGGKGGGSYSVGGGGGGGGRISIKSDNVNKLNITLDAYGGEYLVMMVIIEDHTVSHFSYAPLFKGPHFFTKMLESNILYDNLLIDILSV